ncbi:hypothetical protein TNCT_208291 [Trichonephila clavata]|uniref:Uncharacterized protein n=1 Tax=Trichonephila clavata TaxID=2740835 RepID=A0A8X6GKS9_TRICU|nr:hypothetical protein TNCT_208291 [Trichonephila clavata]
MTKQILNEKLPGFGFLQDNAFLESLNRSIIPNLKVSSAKGKKEEAEGKKEDLKMPCVEVTMTPACLLCMLKKEEKI